ncbi:MAG: methyltransferase [Bryobacteraceae bacterium]
MAIPSQQHSPERIFNTLNCYRQAMALKAAIDLEVFTHIGAGATTVEELAVRCKASTRGVRILCDFLTIQEFLTKQSNSYGLTPESALFLDKRSPAYMGSIAYFLTHEDTTGAFNDLAAAVRKGGTVQGKHMDPENPLWVEFARSMAPMAAMAARTLAPMVAEAGKPMKVLDIAAGHGFYGISVAQHNPAAQIVAVDWNNVLAVAIENARKAGVADRYRTVPGSAFDVDFGQDFDLALITNFVHHFDPETGVKLLKKIRAAMKPGGRVAVVEFVPNDDRVTPPTAAGFSLTMLAATESGDAYTFAEYRKMLADAGFDQIQVEDLTNLPQRVVQAVAK